MKVIIAGSRTITDYTLLEQAIEASGFEITEVVHGKAKGVDMLAWNWGFKNGVRTTPFPAAWETYGKAAGPIRNQKMADYAEALIAVWDGKSRGTQDMINKAKKKGLKVYIHQLPTLERAP